MNAIITETRLWHCYTGDQTISFTSRLKQFNSKSLKHKEKHGTVVKQHEVHKTEYDEVKYIVNDSIK